MVTILLGLLMAGMGLYLNSISEYAFESGIAVGIGLMAVLNTVGRMAAPKWLESAANAVDRRSKGVK